LAGSSSLVLVARKLKKLAISKPLRYNQPKTCYPGE
jgi:hypothetical protein